MPSILHIETGTEVCSVAISRGEEVIALKESLEGRNHARDLGVFVREVLTEAGMAPLELDALAVGMGPGSYTGLRVGVSLAKGLAYGSKIPLIAVSSLEGMAVLGRRIIPETELPHFCLRPMIDARRMEVYTQAFDPQLRPLTEIEAVVIDEHSFSETLADRKIFAFGDGAAKCTGTIRSDHFVVLDLHASARGLIPIALEKFRHGEFVDTAYFEPFYLKDFVVGPPAKMG